MPDSVPLRNSMKLGADDKAVIALVPLRDSLMVFKEDGLFKVTGSGGVFSWEQVDTTIRLLGPELAASLENQVFALTDQGVVAIPEQGAPKVVGYDIQDKLPTTTSSSVSWFGFVVAQESRREFRVAVMSSDQFYSTIPNEQWVYNTFTDSWTHHLIYATAGLVTPTSDPTYPDYLYLADGLVNQVRREVKSSSDFYNHYDNTFGGSISSSGGNTVTIAAAPTAWALAVGDAIEQGSNRSTITAINGLVLTVADTLAWSGGACTLYGGFESDIQWTPFAQPNPCMLKQFPEVSATFRQAAFSTATLSFWTDLMPNANAVAMAGPGPIGGTLGPWLMRAWVPQDDQMASQLNVKLSIRNALGSWQLQGLNVSSSPFSMAAHK